MPTQNIIDTLTGQTVPSLVLVATNGSKINLATLKGISVVYAYPRTSPPNQPPIEGWDLIPGARGCTPQSKSYGEYHNEIIAAGASRVFGLSTQSSEYQKEVAERLSLPFYLLSDDKLKLAAALSLPTFEAASMTLLTRITIIIENGNIKKVFFPVNEPNQNAVEVAAYLKSEADFK
ncbi:MAG: peroxiredoxin [Oceanospirillaceae bacterium]|jgi:peroxiredoxin